MTSIVAPRRTVVDNAARLAEQTSSAKTVETTNAAAVDAVKEGSACTVAHATDAAAEVAQKPAVDAEIQAGARRVSLGTEAQAAQRVLPRTSTPAAMPGIGAKPTTALSASTASTSNTTATSTTAPTTAPRATQSMSKPGLTDVGHMQPGELDRLKKSADPADRRRAATIARAQTAYADHMKKGARVLVGTSAGNGGHPVVTLLPPGFDPSKPAKVQTHYHGFNATVADPANHSSGTTRAMNAAMANDPQQVFVLPEASNARAGSYATNWGNVSSQARTTNDALAAAGITNVSQRIVSAHSGGGAALQRAMQSQRDGSGVQADRVVLHDSLYGSEHAVAAWGNTPAGRRAELSYVHGSNTAGRDAGIKRAFGDRFHRIDVGNRSDSHNRTVYEHFQGR